MTSQQPLVISQLGISPTALRGETVIVTGAGGGIGFEAARALLWLGANVVVTEVNPLTGAQAAEKLGGEFDPQRVLFVPTDVGDEASVQELARQTLLRFGKVDGILNNATIAVLGTVKDLPIERWDASYRVNLRGPVLLARTFLPGMISRRHGAFLCVSSTGTAFLGGYETFKAAQVHLANTLDAELEGTGVNALTIGPGLVPTETAMKAVDRLAPLMGMTVDEFFTLNKNAVLTIEEAGAGFAMAVLLAEKFRGQEISSMQALKAANVQFGSSAAPVHGSVLDDPAANHKVSTDVYQQALVLCQAVRSTLAEQAEGWKHRSLFERQWVIRDFRKTAGMPVEEWLEALKQLEECIREGKTVTLPPLGKLAGYYNHMAELAKGYEKDPARLEDSLRHVYGWKDEVTQLDELLK